MLNECAGQLTTQPPIPPFQPCAVTPGETKSVAFMTNLDLELSRSRCLGVDKRRLSVPYKGDIQNLIGPYSDAAISAILYQRLRLLRAAQLSAFFRYLPRY
jgi:hypothetical protein